MQRFSFLICLFILLSSNALTQSFVISGSIEHAVEETVFLASFYGDRFRILDSMEISNGFFYFVLSEEDPVGIYRLIYSERDQGIRAESRFIEFIYNKKNIEVYIASGEQGPVPYFENSIENAVYKEFMDFELNYESQILVHYSQLISSKSPQAESELLERRYDELQDNRSRYLDSMTTLFPDLFAIRIMNAFGAAIIPGELSHRERIDTLKMCFFDHAAIDDPMLLYAPVYTFKLIDYLSLFKVDTLSKEQQEQKFIEAVDRIMINVSNDSELRSFVVEFLLEGFEMLDMEMVQFHLAEHYLDESCKADIVDMVLSRMEAYKTLATGQKAPDFIIRDMFGMNHQLSRLQNPYVLVLFWASTCEHCQEMLPELHQWYLHENTLNMEVVAISIDTSYANFEIIINSLHPEWISVFDPMGWNGKVPGDYFIYATPSLFLLDKQGTILTRPTSFRQFTRFVKKLELK